MWTRRWLWIVLWIAIGVLVWNVIYDLHISRGVRAYLQASAEAELGRRPAPSMHDIMISSQQSGAMAATTWAAVVVGAGWSTLWACSRLRFRRSESGR